MDVEAAEPVDRGSGLAVERAQLQQIEHRAEVDEERIVALAGEDLDAVGRQLTHRRSRESPS